MSDTSQTVLKGSNSSWKSLKILESFKQFSEVQSSSRKPESLKKFLEVSNNSRKSSIKSIEELLVKDKTFTIHSQNIQSLAIEMYKAVNNLPGGNLSEFL